MTLRVPGPLTRLYEFEGYTCAPGGRGVQHLPIPLLHGCVTGLPEGLDALLVAGDLQAVDSAEAPLLHRRQVGEVIAEELELLASSGLLPESSRTGVILTGDLFAVPTLDVRGGLGEVEGVWRAFGSAFRWVCGVAGNHDRLAGRLVPPPSPWHGNLYVLDGEVVELDGLRLGGVCGVFGAKGKAWRRSREDYLEVVRQNLSQAPDVLIFHESPAVGAEQGDVSLAEALEGFEGGVCSGHVHWKAPLQHPGSQTWCLNVDARVVLLSRVSVEPI